MDTEYAPSASERAPYSLTALVLLANPVSKFLDRDWLIAIADIAFRQDQRTTRAELALLIGCARDLRCLGSKLKLAFIEAYAAGDIDAACTQRLVDCFELWDD